MSLSTEERNLIKDLIDRGELLPDEFRFRLFKEPREAELVWPGKTHEVTQAVLPFQSIEQIDEPRSDETGAYGSGDLFSVGKGGRQTGGWSNKLIWGDNKLVLSSLKGGPLRRQIEEAGGLKLIYIDPPFDVGADFSFEVEIGDSTLTKDASVIEDIAYRDTWGRGLDSYYSMISERLYLAFELLSRDGSIFVHCDWRVNSGVRLIMDELFGARSLRNTIAYCYSGGGLPQREMPKKYDTIFWYSKGENWTYNPIFRSYSEGTVQRGRTAIKGPDAELRAEGTPINDWWPDVKKITSPTDPEKLYYPTQKSEDLLGRVINLASNEGDLVADFFCGSGTTLAVAEKLGRKWIGADLGRFAIHTTRKRLIGVQRQLKTEGKSYRSFEILNLGKYERQWFAGMDPTLPEAERARVAATREARYVSLILEAYHAQPVEQSPPFHGVKSGALILVGPVDAPVTENSVEEAIAAARAMDVARIDVLGFEFEMGLAPQLVEKAKAKGVSVALRWIPKDVFDTRAVKAGQVAFYDLAYVDARAEVTDKRQRTICVSLTDFGVSYRQDDLAELIAALKPSGSKVTVVEGQVVKLTKAKSGEVTREVLTKQWTDWIDYWAVDFDYASKPETIYETRTRADGSTHHVPQWTGRYIFENEWQSFRTRRDRTLELVSAPHTYAGPGRKAVAIKVIDIFGNDTTKVIGVEV